MRSSAANSSLEGSLILDGSYTPAIRIAIVANLISREVISSEFVYYLKKFLCTSTKLPKNLEHLDFLLVPVVNIGGRDLVEQGDFCRLSSKEGINFDRNWPTNQFVSRKIVVPAYEQFFADFYGGDTALSAPETRALDLLLRQFKPHAVFNIRSGLRTLDVGYPPSALLTGFKVVDPVHLKSLATLAMKSTTKPVVGSIVDLSDYQYPSNFVDYVFHHLRIEYVYLLNIYRQEQQDWGFNKARRRRINRGIR